MTQLAINGHQLSCFGLVLLLDVVILRYVFVLINNKYVVRRQQTKGPDYEEEIIKMWRPFVWLIIFCLFLLTLPFLLIEAQTNF